MGWLTGKLKELASHRLILLGSSLVLTGVMLIGVAQYSARNSSSSNAEPVASAAVIRDLTNIGNGGVAPESGYRGYVLTGETGPAGERIIRNTLLDGNTGASAAAPNERSDAQGGSVPINSIRWITGWERITQLPSNMPNGADWRWQLMGFWEIHGTQGVPQATVQPEVWRSNGEYRRRLNNGMGLYPHRYFDLWPITFNKWEYVEVGVNYRTDSAGWLEIYRNGQLVKRVTGPITAEAKGGYWKIANYRTDGLTGPGTYDMSGVRVWDNRPPLPRQVSGSGTPTNPVPAPPPATTPTTPVPSQSSGSRNVYQWPFSVNSVWNTPIGSGAQYVAANLPRTNGLNNRSDAAVYSNGYIIPPGASIDADLELIGVNPNDPVKTLSTPYGTAQVHVPTSMSWDGSWNGCATFLGTDKKTIYSGQPLKLTPGGNPYWLYDTSNWPINTSPLDGISIYGGDQYDGRVGCHGGSALSGIGGTIRKGDLAGSGKVRHALKVNIWCTKLCSPNGITGKAYRWPALKADTNATNGHYNGTNSALQPGSLLALPPNVDISFIRSDNARQLAEAMRDYGVYVVDETAMDRYGFSVERGAEFADGVQFYNDLIQVMTKLAVVNNNTQQTPGGGGTPRAPLAPCFTGQTGCVNAPTTPTTPIPTQPTPTTPTTPIPTQPTSKVTPETIMKGLDTPWAMQFASDGRLYFTERPGRVRVYENGSLRASALITIPRTETLSAEEGLQGMALDPNFATNGFMYLYYSYECSGVCNRLARITLDPASGTLKSGLVTILDNIRGFQFHNGGRIKFGPDGKLYVAVGDGANNNDTRSQGAQDINSLNGKILRVNAPDASIPSDNPFPGSRVWSYGHRNPQGLAWHPSGPMWSTEHGPTGTPGGHDEANRIDKGKNYGWPKYYGNATHPLFTNLTVSNAVSPLANSEGSIWAPGGAMFYTGSKLDATWKNKLIFTGLGIQGRPGARALYRLPVSADGNRVAGSLETLYQNQFGRLRDVVEGPDGAIYLATSNRDGRGSPNAEDDRIIRLKPQGVTTGTPPVITPSPSEPSDDSNDPTPPASTPAPVSQKLTEVETIATCNGASCRPINYYDVKASKSTAVDINRGNLKFIIPFSFDKDGTYNVGLTMRSQSYRGAAKVDLYLDGIRIKAGYTLTDDGKYNNYFVNRAFRAGKHTLAVLFINDKCGNFIPRVPCKVSTDRNVWIDQLRIAGNVDGGTDLPTTPTPAPPPSTGGGSGTGSTGGGTTNPFPTPTGSIIFRGDYETGSLSQWAGNQRVATDRIRIVTNPVRQGTYAARYEVRDGDCSIRKPDGSCYGERAEVQAGISNTGGSEGQDRTYQWSTMFDQSFPYSNDWATVTQWHCNCDGPPPFGFYTQSGDKYQLQVNRYNNPTSPIGPAFPWSMPIKRGEWIDVKLRVKWSGSDSVGSIQLWINGQPQTFGNGTTTYRGRTLIPGYSTYFKQGYYRSNSYTQTGVVYHDGFTVTSN